MTDRFSGLVVILEDDVREEEAGPLIAAIARFRGVLDVRQVTSRPGLEFVLRSRIRTALRERMLAVLGDTDEGAEEAGGRDERDVRRVAW